MNKLILATSMIGLALVTTQAQAGERHYQTYKIHSGDINSGVAPATNLKSKPRQTACDCSNCSAEHCPLSTDGLMIIR
jgi:hypothetical protein